MSAERSVSSARPGAGALAALLLAAALVAGCGGPPRPGEPITRGDLENILATASACSGDGPIRISGTGELEMDGRVQAFSFVMLHDPPGWVRADARPALSTIPLAVGVSALLVGDHLVAHVPSSGSWLTMRLRDRLPGIERLDAGSFLTGRPDLGVLARLSHPRLSREEDRLVVTGDIMGRTITASFDPAGMCVRGVSLEHGDLRASISYGEPLDAGPEGTDRTASTVRIDYADGTTEATLRLFCHRAAAAGPVDRDAYDLTPPAPSARRSEPEGEEPR